MADTKKEYTSNLHPKGDLGTTVYPNVKSENIIDKDTTAYTAGKVPDSSLVSKSLDSLNEKIETNKIQTETNKTNIAKNTQDITNLKANYTEVQSQVNTNSRDIALLETNAVKKDTDTSLKSLTLPSASDLKTKDGTTFGGVDENPTLKSVTTDKLYINTETEEGYNRQHYYLYLPTYKTNIGGASFAYHISITQPNGDIRSLFEIVQDTDDIHLLIKDPSNTTNNSFKIGTDSTKAYLIYKRSNLTYNYTFPKKSGTLALTSDLETKQEKRFVHTVEIHYASNGSYFCFTGTSDKNTPIASVQDLTTVFANRDFGGVGVFGSAGLSKIHVGSSVNDTTFKKYMNNGEYANPSEETFATVFNTTGFTITDSVTAL